MSKYLFVESRDPFALPDVGQSYALAGDLAGDGHEVTVYLVQNGVLAARAAATSGGLQTLAATGNVAGLADDYSLDERGMDREALAAGVRASGIDDLVDLMLDGAPKVVWH